MRMLKQVAPKFGRIWNGRQHSKSPFDLSKRSFMNVSIHKFLLHYSNRFLRETYLGFAQILGATSSSLLCTVTRNLNSENLIDPIHGR